MKRSLFLLLVIFYLLFPKRSDKTVLIVLAYDSYSCEKDDIFKREGQYLKQCIKADTSITSCSEKQKYLHLLNTITLASSDTLILYIGTHGYIEKNVFTIYLDDSLTAIELKNVLKHLKCSIILIADTCHSGAIISEFANNFNISIITACGKTQRAKCWLVVKNILPLPLLEIAKNLHTKIGAEYIIRKEHENKLIWCARNR